MKKGSSVLSTIVARTMSEKGLTEDQVIAQIATSIYGAGENSEQDAKNIDAVRAILNYNEVGKRKVETAVKAAGGTEDEVTMAGLIVSSEDFKNGKSELDQLAKDQLAECIARFWNEFDEKSYKPFYEGQFARGPQLLADYKAAKAKEAEKAAKKAAAAEATTVETTDAPVAETVTDDPFDN